MICTETEYNAQSEKCQKCEWIEDCKNEKSVPAEFVEKLKEASVLWREAKEYEKLAEDKMRMAKGMFTTFIKDTGVAEFRSNGLSVTYKQQSRVSYDSKLIELLVEPKVIERIRKETPYYVMRVRDLTIE